MYYTVGKHSSVVIPPGSDAITSGVYGDVEIAPSDMWIKALYNVMIKNESISGASTVWIGLMVAFVAWV